MYEQGNKGKSFHNGYKPNAFKSNPYPKECTLPKDYLVGGYYKDSEKKVLNKDYVVRYAKDIASSLENDGARESNKRTQIRKYYDYVVRLYDQMLAKQKRYEEIEAELQELIKYVNYASGRKVVSSLFVKFIERNLENIQDAADLKAFVKHFESVVAFSKKD